MAGVTQAAFLALRHVFPKSAPKITSSELPHGDGISRKADWLRVVVRDSGVPTKPAIGYDLICVEVIMGDSIVGDGASEPPTKVKTIAAGILSEFFDALVKEEGLEDVAPRLRKVVLGDGIFAEPAIRAAMFPEAS